MNYVGFIPLLTGFTESVGVNLSQIKGNGTTHISTKATMPVTSTIMSRGQGYVVSKVCISDWNPSSAEIEAAMAAYEFHPESNEEFKERLFLSLVDDVDGIYP